MSTTSSRTVQIQFSGDTVSQIIQSALDNLVSPSQLGLTTLNVGNNSVSVPVISGVTSTGLLIIPPAGNTTIITMKGVNADTGFPIHITDPTSLSVDPSFTSLVLNVSTQIIGVRLIWT
jgi:hypothetical protein